MQLLYNLSNPALEDALYDSMALQRFLGLVARNSLPDKTTTLNYRHLLERQNLCEALPAEITKHVTA